MALFTLNKLTMLMMERLGKCIARNPLFFLFTSTIISGILATGMFFSKYERDFIKLMEVQGSKFTESEKLIASLFPLNASVNFDAARMIELPKGTFIYILNKNGSGVLNELVFQDIHLIDDIVHNISIFEEGKIVKYSDLCAKKDDSCFPNPIMKIVPEIKKIADKRYRFKYPLDINEINYVATFYGFNFGGVTVDEEGYVEDVMAVRLIYFLDSSYFGKSKYIKKWETAVANEIGEHKFKSVHVYTSVYSEIEDATQQIAESLLPMIGVVASIMIVFSTLTFMTNSWIRSKPWLGVAAGTSAGLATAASFGFTSLVGISFNFFNAVIPFLILGTEIDDAFVLVASWRATKPEDGVENRMGETFSKAAVSITVTSLTNFIAYCIGINASISLMKNACAHTAVCILFTYVCQLTFFGSCMALDGRREEQKRNAVTFVTVKENREDNGNQEEIVTKFIQNHLGGLITMPFIKFTCLALFLLNLSLGIYGIYHLKIGADFTQLLEPGSRIDESLQLSYRYFSAYPYTMHITVNKPLNYADSSVQESIEEMLKLFENHPHIADDALTVSWLKYYKMFAGLPIAKFSLGAYNLSEKQDFIDGLRNVFLKIENTKQFKEDINFNDDFTEITSSRFIVILKDIRNFEIEKSLTKDISGIMEKSDIPINVFSFLFYKGEQGIVLETITTRCIWLTILVITGVFFIFVGRILHVLLVTVCVISSMIETIGYMALWDVRLDTMATLGLILCLGFSINYPTHFSYAFITSTSKSGDKQMKMALYKVGLPIIQGSVTTIVAVAILIFQSVKIYNDLFKIIFLIVFETAFHSLFVIPSALSVLSNLIPKNPYKRSKPQNTTLSLESEKELFTL